MDTVWYAAYGSNMHFERLGYYLRGGTPPGSARTYPGCRNGDPPRRTVPTMLPGGIYFALESVAWTGGMALYDPQLPGRAAARAYLLTVEQFADVATQEMYRTPPGVGVDLIVEAVAAGSHRFGDGRYETLVCPATLDGIPVLTFTAPWRSTDVAWNRPSALYVSMLASGLHESHGWDADAIAAYLAGRPGIDGRWSPAELAETVGAAVARAAAGRPTPEEATDRPRPRGG